MGAAGTIGRSLIRPEERRRRMRAHVLRPHARWTAARKLALCIALRGAVVSLNEAAAATGIDAEEISRWLEAFRRRGAEGLRVDGRVRGSTA